MRSSSWTSPRSRRSRRCAASASPNARPRWAAAALTTAEKCQAAKLKITGKYAFCRLKAEAKSVKKGVPADYTKCVDAFYEKITEAQTEGGPTCALHNPTLLELGLIAHTGAFKLLQARFVDNGDGTISDTETGLLWEKKDIPDGVANYSNPHDADNDYTWSATGPGFEVPSGTAFTDLLSKLNNCSYDPAAVTPIVLGFAGHCDWRLPTVDELGQLSNKVNAELMPCGTNGVCHPVVGPAREFFPYWSATTAPGAGPPSNAWTIYFNDGAGNSAKNLPLPVRAVRGGD
jgi:hypothetical protein